MAATRGEGKIQCRGIWAKHHLVTGLYGSVGGDVAVKVISDDAGWLWQH